MQADCSVSPGFSSPSCCPRLPLCSHHPLESLPEMRLFRIACTATLLRLGLHVGPSDFLIPTGRSQALQSNCCPGNKITCSFSFTEHAQSWLHQNMSCHNSNNSLLGDLHSSHSQASHLSWQVIRAGTSILISIYQLGKLRLRKPQLIMVDQG